MKHYQLTFKLIENDEQAAKAFCDEINKGYTYYMRKHHPAHYTPYFIPDNDHKGTPWNGFIVWYEY